MRLIILLALAAFALSLFLAQPRPQTLAVNTAHAGDATRGKILFEKRCTGCHSLTEDREGPRLAGVYGRTSGTVPGFAYSDPLKKAHIIWSDNTLDQWLTGPDTLVPDNNMDFRVIKASERRDLIAFLRKSSGQ